MSFSHNRSMLEQQIKEKRVLETELKQMKKGGSVYMQQPNSQIFFKEDATKVFADCKRSLDDLIEEYKQVEVTEDEQMAGEQ